MVDNRRNACPTQFRLVESYCTVPDKVNKNTPAQLSGCALLTLPLRRSPPAAGCAAVAILDSRPPKE